MPSEQREGMAGFHESGKDTWSFRDLRNDRNIKAQNAQASDYNERKIKSEVNVDSLWNCISSGMDNL
jgi:hypothetical protein